MGKLIDTLRAVIDQAEKKGGIDVSDLKAKDTIEIEAGEQRITLQVISPRTGEVFVLTTAGPMRATPHACTFWGSSLHLTGLAVWTHRLIPGQRLCLGIWMTPPMTRITLNGYDLIAASMQKDN